MAEREIIYRLKLEADAANQKILDEFRRASEQVDSAINRSRQASQQQQAGGMRAAAQQAGQSFDTIRQSGVRAHESIAAAAARAQQQTERTLRRQSDQAQREYDSSVARLRGARAQFADSINATAEGVMRVGRGFVSLGLVGEENTQKIIDTLLTMQGAFDLVLGGINTYRQLTRAVEAYRAAVMAAAAAEGAAATVRGLAAGAGAARGAGGAAAGALGGAVAGGAAGRALPFGMRALGGAAATLALPAVGLGLAGAAALGGGVLAYERFGASGTSAIYRQTAEREEQFAAFREQRDREQAFAAADREERMALSRSRAAGRFSGLDARLRTAGTDRQRLGVLGESLDATRQETASARRSGDEEAVSALLQQQITLTQQRADIEQSVIADKRRSNDESIRRAEQELSLTQQRLKVERDRLAGAKESFGLLSEREQAKLIAIQQRGAAGGTLSREDLGELSRVGLGSSESIVRTQASARADAAARRAGGTFEGIFGGVEAGRIRELESRETNVRIAIEGSREIKVKLEADSQRMAQVVREEILPLLAEQSKRDEELIRRELDQVRREIAQQAAARDSTFRGRR